MNQTVGTPLETRQALRVRIFIDYWNFQLTLNEREASERGLDDYRFKIDWKGVGPWLVKKACDAIGVDDRTHSFDGVIIYASHNPLTAEGRGFRKWATTWLDRQPGVSVVCLERKPKALPKCPKCYREIEYCPNQECRSPLIGTVEKGVDTYIATDMIRLAWENAYDLAVLATSDSDLVPAVKFLDLKARKVVQAGFPPSGVDLATACWASFDVYPSRQEINRKSN
ncbi:MAG: NYN domain-containing protein [candidate division NC10 bacterium]|nr:NYN domain-containing protein [candidate division NC10 bacterium]